MASAPADLVNELLADVERQAGAGDLGGFSGTITKCLAPPKALHEVAAAPAFWRNTEALMAGVRAENEQAVTLALGELGRLSASLKSHADRLRPLAANLLRRGVPSHFCHGDADLTTFAAKGWVCSGQPVDLAVAVRTVAMADAPKPLVPWLELALSAGDVSTVLDGIASCLRESAAGEAEQGNKRATRVQRLLVALRSALDADRITLDSDVSNALAGLVAKAFRGVPAPSYAAGAKAAEELMSLALHVIRMDLQLLTEPAIYNSVSGAGSWLPSGGWRRFAKSAPSAARLRKTLLDSLIILLKQGNPNQALLESHRLLSSDSNTALAEAKRAAQADRTIPAKERNWLASGGKTKIARAESALTETDDTVIGMALLAVEALARCELLDSDRGLDAPVRELVERAREARNRVLSVVHRRDLRVFGAPGEDVKFSPQAHQLMGSEAAPDRVVVVEPGVEAAGSFGRHVVVPAIVKVP